MLFFSSSRWPLVVSRGTLGALPGPLWLWLSSGMGGMFFVIMVSVVSGKRTTPRSAVSFRREQIGDRPHNRPRAVPQGGVLKPVTRCDALPRPASMNLFETPASHASGPFAD